MGALYTSIMCSESLTYYILTKDDRQMSAIKLGGINDSAEMKRYDLPAGEDVDWL